MSFRSMGVSAFLIFAVCNALMTYLTIGKERERAMLFPDYYFFGERRLLNHTFMKEHVKNLDDCELLCYLDDNCVSLNFKKDPNDNHICELNNATHLKDDSDLTTDTNFHYRGSKSACDKNSECPNNATCQSGFTLKGYQCLCPPGFTGEHCENDIDECETYRDECHVNAICSNTVGSYLCTCKPGYTGDGQTCKDIDECVEHHCYPHASCANTHGSFYCSCLPKYIWNGFKCEVDPCHHYTNLSDANRKSSYTTPDFPVLCDDELAEGWYRFVGAAGTKMPTTRVPTYKCGTEHSGWLNGNHSVVEDGEVPRKVCFSNHPTGCKDTKQIFLKNCRSYYVYKLFKLSCSRRYCGTE